eukprot:TRINITY_DN12572_c0_g1_i1.p1 TRINITY_DN12572_c0_g1~~TRINITY_DN12572_c0_g1_i1.p1  ORF type:complete len:233 (-),score=55.65 TRINITY_DN12572_c0_g1_i1:125-802(-)
MKYLVAVDGSKGSDWAFHVALHSMDPLSDEMVLCCVNQLTPIGQAANAIKSLYASIAGKTEPIPGTEVSQEENDKHAIAVLDYYTNILDELKIVHAAILGTAAHIGSFICEVEASFQVDRVVVGRRGMGAIESLVFGSVSRYIIENAKCDVLVVKREPPFPEEVHGDKESIIKEEEKERYRRLHDPMEAAQADSQRHVSQTLVLSKKGKFFHVGLKDGTSPVENE